MDRAIPMRTVSNVIPRSLIANLFFLAVLFPFISLVPTSFDIQPYTVFASLLLLAVAVCSNEMKLPADLWLLGVPLLYAAGILWIPGLPNVAGLRGLNGYVSVFAIAAATYLWARHINVKLFVLAVYTWLAVALIQLFIYRDFGRWLLPRFDPDYGLYRGVASLATEPAHYAAISYFFLLLNELFYSYDLYAKRQYLLLAGALLLQIIMSFSGLGMAYLLSFIFLKLFIVMLHARLSPKSVMRALVILLLLLAAFVSAFRSDYLRSTRAVSLVRIVLANPGLLQQDESIRQRVQKMVVPAVGLFRSYGTGFGLTSWEASAGPVISGENTLVRFPTPRGMRISSGWGSSLFELGVFGLGLIAVVSWVMIRGMLEDRSRRGLYLLILLSTHAALINATPIAFPPFPFLIGICAVFVRKSTHRWPGPRPTGI